MAAVSNGNILGMLGQFVDVVQRVGVANFLVVALDERTVSFLNKKGCPNYLRKLRSRTGSTDNHATCVQQSPQAAQAHECGGATLTLTRPFGAFCRSGLKFQILHEMLSVGVSVLLSDVDIVITQN
eukprot:1778994-Prymnesium_polylepis.1